MKTVYSFCVAIAGAGLLCSSVGCTKVEPLKVETEALVVENQAIRQEIDLLDNQIRAVGSSVRFASLADLEASLATQLEELEAVDREISEWSKHAQTTATLKQRLIEYRGMYLEHRS